MTLRMNQVLAKEKDAKDRIHKELSELHKLDQKPAKFNGFARQYEKKAEDGEDFPPEAQRVEMRAEDVLKRVAALMTELVDVTATKDIGNTSAKGKLTIAGREFELPATHLLFLESKLVDVKDILDKMPTLDSAEDWSLDGNAQLYKSAITRTHKTKKLQKAIVLYPATDKHPAQTQLITEDEVVGYWSATKQSGALPAKRKQQLLDRVTQMLQAVKMAREEANTLHVTEQHIGSSIFETLFAP